ncbi:hypothetical protein SCHPADRAFT_906559 [Schizopora paradoxa]|uniref:CNH domain-containing protein n=1 Tax=Schizopora paradoxa TaxID=27342 RepID=A0A0H2RG19_9AGAM|nr:hypothetical protein SCHPADRAFT_906559 [Schizopora paradoxa]
MAPFHEPFPILKGFKERVDSLAIQGDRLLIGTNSGTLHILENQQSDDSESQAKIVSTKNLSRKPIDQLGYVKDINSIVALSDSLLTLYPLPDLVPPTPLPSTRTAFSFAVDTTVQHMSSDGKFESFDDVASEGKSKGVPTVVTYLVVGCRRKLVVYSWRDGEPQDVKEAPLPHSARTIAFVRPSVLCLAYSATEHVMFFLETMSTAELTLPVGNVPTSSSIGIGMNALTGLGGFVTLGMAAKAKPLITTVGDEVLIPKDNSGLLLGADGKAKQTGIVWHGPPEDLAFVKPYVISILPAGTVPATSIPDASPLITGPNGLVTVPALHIHSSISCQPVQSMVLPIEQRPGVSGGYTIRFLTPSLGSKSPVYVVTSRTDRASVTAEGQTVWVLQMRSWSEQLDELVERESYEDALALLETIDAATLPDKDFRRARLRGLNAVAKFKRSEYDAAIDDFLSLEINPSKVVALFPESISGRLFVPPDDWIPLFGGPSKPKKEEIPASSSSAAEVSRSPRRTPSPSSSVPKAKTLLTNLKQATTRDDDAASIRSVRRDKSVDKFTRSVETLIRYLSDRRPKVTHALSVVNITPSQSHKFPFLSETSVEELMELPNYPLSSLTPEQLTRFAQILDTALFKSYLVIRPAMLGPLCRIDNWCEVSEVEGILQERERFSELIFLYNGKKMHGKALTLLRRLSDNEPDVEEKVRPTITYIQKLGPEYLDQIFDASRWIYKQDTSKVLEVFTSELVELPRSAVTDFLEELDTSLCIQFLEYLISEREEVSPVFHDRLAELYLGRTTSAKKKSKPDFDQAYSKFLTFIQTTDIYRVDRLFGLLPLDDMFEARAVLLGRLGRHEAALETYVYRLRDYIKAEEYCKSIYIPNTPTEHIFLSLLKIYLEPTQKQSEGLLKPALELISRQSPRLDTVETLRLLPPLVTAQDVKAFLIDAVRGPVFDTKVVREVNKARSQQIARKLMALENHRVKISDIRICPQCHKRLGNSVIAVHSPKGEVTHYQCREAFVKNKKDKKYAH